MEPVRAYVPTRPTELPGVVDPSDAANPEALSVVPGLVWAFRIQADGSAQSLPIERPIESGRAAWLWLHLNLADARAREWLSTLAIPASALKTKSSKTLPRNDVARIFGDGT